MSGPEISVIMPVYNGAKFLRESLQAILRQTFSNFELLVIDDGSTDDSADIIRALPDTRIRYIRQSNQGLCAALNRGIREAAAPLIARNDHDDLSLPHRLERQRELITANAEAIAVFSHYTKFGKKRGWDNADKQSLADGSAEKVDPLRHGCLLGSTMMATTNSLRAVKGYRQSCYPCDDYDLEMRLCELGEVLLIRENLVRYRFHTSANTYRTFKEMQAKTRWLACNYTRRQQKQEELSFGDFVHTRNVSARSHFNERRIDQSKLHMRFAGQYYLDGRDLLSLWHLAVAFTLDPVAILSRTKRVINTSA
jgi:glycosyltransferase involved in cell wall biosynthesis